MNQNLVALLLFISLFFFLFLMVILYNWNELLIILFRKSFVNSHFFQATIIFVFFSGILVTNLNIFLCNMDFMNGLVLLIAILVPIKEVLQIYQFFEIMKWLAGMHWILCFYIYLLSMLLLKTVLSIKILHYKCTIRFKVFI